MIDFFINNFENCIWLAVILIAIIPTLEGRIALPFALAFSSQISPYFALFLAFLGSIIPCLPIMYMIRIIKNKSGFLSNKLNSLFNDKYLVKFSKINNKKNNLKKLVALSLFVAIPLPMTGVWSGSIIAGFTKLNIWQCFLFICFGSFIACCIILTVCLLFGNNVIYFLSISLIIISIIIIFEIIKFLIKKRKSK